MDYRKISLMELTTPSRSAMDDSFYSTLSASAAADESIIIEEQLSLVQTLQVEIDSLRNRIQSILEFAEKTFEDYALSINAELLRTIAEGEHSKKIIEKMKVELKDANLLLNEANKKLKSAYVKDQSTGLFQLAYTAVRKQVSKDPTPRSQSHPSNHNPSSKTGDAVLKCPVCNSSLSLKKRNSQQVLVAIVTSEQGIGQNNNQHQHQHNSISSSSTPGLAPSPPPLYPHASSAAILTSTPSSSSVSAIAVAATPQTALVACSATAIAAAIQWSTPPPKHEANSRPQEHCSSGSPQQASLMLTPFHRIEERFRIRMAAEKAAARRQRAQARREALAKQRELQEYDQRHHHQSYYRHQDDDEIDGEDEDGEEGYYEQQPQPAAAGEGSSRGGRVGGFGDGRAVTGEGDAEGDDPAYDPDDTFDHNGDELFDGYDDTDLSNIESDGLAMFTDINFDHYHRIDSDISKTNNTATASNNMSDSARRRPPAMGIKPPTAAIVDGNRGGGKVKGVRFCNDSENEVCSELEEINHSFY